MALGIKGLEGMELYEIVRMWP